MTLETKEVYETENGVTEKTDFGSNSLTEPIELIAVRDTYSPEIFAIAGCPPKPKTQYTAFMVNNAHLSADEIKEGKGSSNPYIIMKDDTHPNVEYPFIDDDRIKKDSFHSDGCDFYQFRAKVVPCEESRFGEATRYDIDWSSVEPSTYGKFTEEVLNKHNSNTKTICELSQSRDKVQETQKTSPVAEQQAEAKSAETEGKSKQQKDYLFGDFGKKSGNPTKDVELIAVVKPGCFSPGGFNARLEDDNPYRAIGCGSGNENKSDKAVKPEVAYVEIMANNGAFSSEDIKSGKGYERPNLHTCVSEDGKKYSNSFPIPIKMYQDIMENGGANAYTRKDGTQFVPFRADIVSNSKVKKDDKDQPVVSESGNYEREMIGYKPKMDTVKPTELGQLTNADITKHFENTKAIHEVKSNYRAKAKAAKLEVSASMAPSAEKSVPELENEFSVG